MDSIEISYLSRTRDGLKSMMEAAIGPNEIVQVFMPMQWALFIVEVAKRAPDKEEWFPHGKWATIQMLQEKIDKELNTIKWDQQF